MKIKLLTVAAGAALYTALSSDHALAMNLESGPGSVVQDNRTQLTWLRLSESIGFTPSGALGVFPEYRLATTSEIIGLLESAQEDFGGDIPPLDGGGITSSELGGGIRTLFGGTGSFGAMVGRFDDGDTSDGVGALQYFPGTRSMIFGTNAFPASSSSHALFLVQGEATTAIPTPALLPGLIGMGIAIFRRGKHETEADMSA